jgi:hypothetical protein
MQKPKILFASSGVGLGHIVRDVYLARYMDWADISWLTTGSSLKYLSSRKARINGVSYELQGLNSLIEDMFVEGNLRISLRKLRRLFDVVKENRDVILESGILEEFDGIVADGFWEMLFIDRLDAKTVFLTDFVRFKPQRNSLLQRILIPYVNRSLKKHLLEFDRRIYVGLIPIESDIFDFYGQIYTHDREPKNIEEGDYVLINLGGTGAGEILVKKSLLVTNKLGMKAKIIGSYQHFVPDPLDYIVSARLIITTSGYSSLIELSRFNKKAVIVPLGGDFEQLDNAEVFRGREGYRVIPMDRLDEASLVYSIESILREKPDPPKFRDASRTISDEIKKAIL